jgi:hypothetical protein
MTSMIISKVDSKTELSKHIESQEAKPKRGQAIIKRFASYCLASC